MAFKLTYHDGETDDYDDSTQWAVEDGVLKMGRQEGDWTVLVSPSHWATIEVGGNRKNGDDKDDSDKNSDNKRKDDKDSDKDDEGQDDDS